MNYPRENLNFQVKKQGERNSMSDSEHVRLRHIGNRGQYNGKQLGTSYTGGKRDSSISFMFFNYPEDWSMGKLWMVFKKYGTVFDMFMVQRRLRSGKKYGFVRYKFVRNVEGLLGQLQRIRFGEEYLTVFVAYDRRVVDARRFVDVVYGRNTSRVEGPDSCKYENGIRINKDRDKGGVELKGAGQYTYDSRETFKINKEFRKKERCIEIEDNEINSEEASKNEKVSKVGGEERDKTLENEMQTDGEDGEGEGEGDSNGEGEFNDDEEDADGVVKGKGRDTNMPDINSGIKAMVILLNPNS
ncbi:transposon TX1 [Tanacetum coccineum]